jgi:hypothetical protein
MVVSGNAFLHAVTATATIYIRSKVFMRRPTTVEALPA